MPISAYYSKGFLQDLPPLLKDQGVGWIADHSILHDEPENEAVTITELWNKNQGGFYSLNEIYEEDCEVYCVNEDGAGRIDRDSDGNYVMPGILFKQKYWRLIYPPKINNLPSEIADEFVISTDYSQSTSSESGSSSEGSLSADIGFLSSSLSASYTTQVSTSLGIENAYAQGQEATKSFSFPAQSAIAIWQKVQAVQINYAFDVLIKSDKMEELLNDPFIGLGLKESGVSDSVQFRPEPILVEPVIVQSYIDCCPVSKLP